MRPPYRSFAPTPIQPGLSSLGSVDMTTVQKVEVQITDEEKARQERITRLPALSEILNLHDFEARFPLPSPAIHAYVHPLAGYCAPYPHRKSMGILLVRC